MPLCRVSEESRHSILPQAGQTHNPSYTNANGDTATEKPTPETFASITSAASNAHACLTVPAVVRVRVPFTSISAAHETPPGRHSGANMKIEGVGCGLSVGVIARP